MKNEEGLQDQTQHELDLEDFNLEIEMKRGCGHLSDHNHHNSSQTGGITSYPKHEKEKT